MSSVLSTRSSKMTTTIHKLNTGGTACALCGEPIPPGHHASPGEFAGVIRFHFPPSLEMPPVSYRAGSHNKDPRCDGKTARQFFQASREPEVTLPPP